MNTKYATFLGHFLLKLFQILSLKLTKDIFVMLATFLTQLKKLYIKIKIIRVSLLSEKWYLLAI